MLSAAAEKVSVEQEDALLGQLRFLWLELTNKCNLTCAHCYAESGPHPAQADILTTPDYMKLLEEAAAMDCRAVQFIGGEPTLHRGLPDLIAHARALKFEDIEVYTNGTVLTDKLLSCFVEHGVCIAVSVYADDSDIHDAVTGRAGSHARTIKNLKRMKRAGLQIRVGLISMEANASRVEQTLLYVKNLGIDNVGVDRARGVGRGGDLPGATMGLQELCGQCWKGSLCISANGAASSCVMSKAWSVGSVGDGLHNLVTGQRLREVRAMIRDEVWLPRQHPAQAACNPGGHPDCYPNNPCSPKGGCDPCHPTCNPQDPKCTPQCDPPLPRIFADRGRTVPQPRSMQ